MLKIPTRINLYSDTQTRPTRAMRAAMAEAECGDEQNFDDPTVNTLCERMAVALGASSVLIWPRLSLAQVLDQMAGSVGVIGVDSGLSHLAVALGLPHVQIFSQPRAWRAGPVDQAHQRAVGGDVAPQVQAVWDTWQAVMAQQMARAQSPVA